MSIDPSTRSAGYAIWKGDKLKKAGLVRNSKSNEKNWQESGQTICAELLRIGRKWDVERVFCEFPAAFGSLKGEVSAGSGALVKLAWVVGFLDGLFTPGFIPFQLIPVITWKGQLNKEIVKLRIQRILGKSVCKNFEADAWDAVGIGLFVHGRMK